MFDQQQFDPNFIEGILEEAESEKKQKAAAKNAPSVFGKVDVAPPEVKAPENLLGMKASPTAIDNILRFLTSTGSAAIGGGVASRSLPGAVVGGGIQAAINLGKLGAGAELPSPMSRENAGNLFGGIASGGAGAVAKRVPQLSTSMRGLLQEGTGGAVSGALTNAADPAGGALFGGALGAGMGGFSGSLRNRASRVPTVTAEDTANKLVTMKGNPNTQMVSDLSATANSFQPTIDELTEFYGPKMQPKIEVNRTRYAVANKERQLSQLEFNNALKSIDSKLQGVLKGKQKKAYEEFNAAKAALDAASPQREALLLGSEKRLQEARLALDEAEVQQQVNGLPDAYLRPFKEAYEKASARSKEIQERVTPKEYEAYAKALDKLDEELPDTPELMRSLTLPEREAFKLARTKLTTAKTRFSALAKEKEGYELKEGKLKNFSNQLVKAANTYGAIDLDPQRLAQNPNQLEFVKRLSETDKVLDIFRAGEKHSSIIKGMRDTFPPGTEARKNFAGKAIQELLDEVTESGTGTKYNVYGTINSEKLAKSLQGISREGLNTMLDSPTGYDDLTGFIRNLAEAEKYVKKAGNSGFRLSHQSLGTGLGGVLIGIGAMNVAKMSSPEQIPGLVPPLLAIGGAYGMLTWPRIAEAFMEKKNSKIGEAIRKFSRNKGDMGAALNTFRNAAISAWQNGDLEMTMPGKPKLPKQTFIPPALVEQLTAPMKPGAAAPANEEFDPNNPQ